MQLPSAWRRRVIAVRPAPDGQPPAPWREATLSAVLAAFIAVLLFRFAPGPDIAAHLFQRSFFIEHGFSLWNNLWYGGQYEFVTYSLIYYPIAAVTGLGVLAVLSVALASSAFTLLVHDRWGWAARWSSLSFAVVWPGVVITGSLPFALGAALALAAAGALQRRARRTFAALAVLSLAASPLAFLFLALALAGIFVLPLARWPRFHRPLVVAVVAIAVAGELVLWRVFPSDGHYPFGGGDFIGACLFAVAGAVCCWHVERLRALRWVFVLYGVACGAAFAIPSEVGGNLSRVRLAAIPIALLVISVRRWRPVLPCLTVVALGVCWNVGELATSYARAATDSSSAASYWQPTVDWLRTNMSPDYRVEAVDTSAHWPAVYLPEAGIPIARGWFRQADFPANDILYHDLSAADYLGWLHRLGVQYVVLSSATPDYSSQGEADLLRSGASGLSQIEQAGEVTIYSVPNPEPIVTGPGQPRIIQLTAGFQVALDRPGTFRLAVRWSPYWHAAWGCLARAPDGMMTLTTASRGVLNLDFRVTLDRAFDVLVGKAKGTCAPA